MLTCLWSNYPSNKFDHISLTLKRTLLLLEQRLKHCCYKQCAWLDCLDSTSVCTVLLLSSSLEIDLLPTYPNIHSIEVCKSVIFSMISTFFSHYHYPTESIFILSTEVSLAVTPHFFSHSLWQSTIYSLPQQKPILVFGVNRVIYYVTLYVWLLSLCMLFSRV